MVKAFGAALLLLLAGCSVISPPRYTVSACAAGEASYGCQIERYQNVNAE